MIIRPQSQHETNVAFSNCTRLNVRRIAKWSMICKNLFDFDWLKFVDFMSSPYMHEQKMKDKKKHISTKRTREEQGWRLLSNTLKYSRTDLVSVRWRWCCRWCRCWWHAFHQIENRKNTCFTHSWPYWDTVNELILFLELKYKLHGAAATRPESNAVWWGIKHI